MFVNNSNFNQKKKNTIFFFLLVKLRGIKENNLYVHF